MSTGSSGRDAQQHWQSVYGGNAPEDLSWYQPLAAVSLELIRRVAPDPRAAVIDVGGGASTLADGLLAAGYRRITVLDLAARALEQSRRRLGAAASAVAWLEADVLDAELPEAGYDVWHDRAVFHFLVEPRDRQRYVRQVLHAVRPGGHVLVATFAEDGPERCSGLQVARYSPDALHDEFGAEFRLLTSLHEDHVTPRGAHQAFLYCLCRVDSSQPAPRAADPRP